MNKHSIFKDYGGAPLVINLPTAAARNDSFRLSLWTGNDLQLTVMTLPKGEDVGEEMHKDFEQMLRVESGVALIRIGEDAAHMRDTARVGEGAVFFIPAGVYHNVVNVGETPLRLSSVYAPPAHPKGTVHRKKEDDR